MMSILACFGISLCGHWCVVHPTRGWITKEGEQRRRHADLTIPAVLKSTANKILQEMKDRGEVDESCYLSALDWLD